MGFPPVAQLAVAMLPGHAQDAGRAGNLDAGLVTVLPDSLVIPGIEDAARPILCQVQLPLQLIALPGDTENLPRHFAQVAVIVEG